MSVGVILLAGGRSRRFGADKRLTEFLPGKTLLEATLKNISLSQLELLVCLRADDQILEEKLNSAGISCQRCSTADQGIGATLSESIAHIPAWSGVLIALADMPWIQPATFRSVAQHTSLENICIPTFGNQRGHPVGFGRDFFNDLETLNDDRGARSIINKYAHTIKTLPTDDKGILRDVDRPDDIGKSRVSPKL
ncbi:MAG: molybdenum cofactor cytidylyltransferase [Halieaceae bacterium]|jgi:molybdenum cofactor cytidylyltransferase